MAAINQHNVDKDCDCFSKARVTFGHFKVTYTSMITYSQIVVQQVHIFMLATPFDGCFNLCICIKRLCNEFHLA